MINGHLSEIVQTLRGGKQGDALSCALIIPMFGIDIFMVLGSSYSLDLSCNQNQKPFEKKFATLASRAVYLDMI